MKNILIITFFFCGYIYSVHGQTNGSPGISESLLNQNKEQVFLHYNSTFLIAGENLYYKFYSLNVDTGKPNNVSKLGYVELLDKDGKMIFRHHIALENGSGNGDFLIPASIPSGAYKLIAYTRWMLNAGKDNLFKGDLIIINPYLEDQSQILTTEENSWVSENLEKRILENKVAGTGKSFSLSTSKDIYSNRETGSVKINKLRGSANGNFSLSIQKLEEYETSEALNASTYKDIYQNQRWTANSKLVLPDLRGVLMSGKIVREDNGEGLGGKSLVFSIPGESPLVRIARTASDGSFSFNIDSKNFGSRGFFQVLGDSSGEFKIILDELPQITIENLEVSEFKVSPSIAELIRQRSIYNQVENSYAAVKQDSVIQDEYDFPFYGSLPEVYNLDDFTRFPTMQETFVEIIEMSRIRKTRDG